MSDMEFRSLPNSLEEQFPSTIEVVGDDGKKYTINMTTETIARGVLKGYKYPVPVVDPDNFANLVAGFGEDFIMGAVTKVFNAAAQKALDFASEVDVDKETKVGVITHFDLKKCIEALISRQFRGETIAELREMVAKLQNETQSIVKNPKFITMGADGKPTADVEMSLKVQALADRIARLNQQIEDRKRKPSHVEDPEEEPAVA